MTILDLTRSMAGAVAAAAAERDATAGGELVEIGPAEPEPPGPHAFTRAFVVHTGDRRLGHDILEHLFLRRGGPGGRRVGIDRIRLWDGDRLLVETDRLDDLGDEGEGPLRLFAEIRPSAGPRALAARLAAQHDPGLGSFLFRDGSLGTSGEVQVLAGPVDARTEALAAAAAELVAAGRTVLLVAPDERAADRITLAADRWVEGSTVGRIVRVGPPSTADLAGRPHLTLEGAAAGSEPSAMDELSAATEALNGTTATPARRGTGDGNGAAATPIDHGTGGHRAAMSRSAFSERRAAQLRLDEALELAAAAARAHASARRTKAEVDPVRHAYRMVGELMSEVEAATATAAASAAGAADVADELGGGSPEAAGTGATSRLVSAAETATRNLDRRDQVLAELDRTLIAVAASGITPSRVQQADHELRAARAAHVDAERAVLRARAGLARAAMALKEWSDVPAPGSGADRVEVPASERRRLGHRVAAARARIEAAEGPALAGAAVVVATLAELVGDPVVSERVVDHVLVEAADTVAPAYLLWAGSRARRGLTLAVDGAGRPPVPAGTDPARDRWWATSVIDLTGLRDADGEVADHPLVLRVH